MFATVSQQRPTASNHSEQCRIRMTKATKENEPERYEIYFNRYVMSEQHQAEAKAAKEKPIEEPVVSVGLPALDLSNPGLVSASAQSPGCVSDSVQPPGHVSDTNYNTSNAGLVPVSVHPPVKSHPFQRLSGHVSDSTPPPVGNTEDEEMPARDDDVLW